MPRLLNARDVGTELAGAVYVGRPSRWGNPFRIGVDAPTREGVIRLHREWFMGQPDLIDMARRELRGKNLICWCAPLPCHAETLLFAANDDWYL